MDDTRMPSPMITIESSDGQMFQVEVKVAQCSTVFKEMMEALGTSENVVISVPPNAPNISGEILHIIIQWASFHKNDPTPAEDDEQEVKPRDDLSSWETELLPVDHVTLFYLIRAADYLNIKGLLQVTCKIVAKMIARKTAVRVRRILNIVNDFTPDEESQVSRENQWYADSPARLDERDMDSDNDDIPADPVVVDCVGNSIILKTILEHFSNVELIELSFVSKLWNHQARNLMRQRGNAAAYVSCHVLDPLVLERFGEDLRQMNVVPFSGITLKIHTSGNRNLLRPQPVLDSTKEVILDRLPLEYFSVSLNDSPFMEAKWSRYMDGPVLALLKQLLQHFSNNLSHLVLDIRCEHEEFFQNFVRHCTFSNLKFLKLEDSNDDVTQSDAYMNNVRALVSRAPHLQELHSVGRLNLLQNVLEGTQAVLVYTSYLSFRPEEIAENLVDAIRLRRLSLWYCGSDFNLEKFNRMTPRLLRASSTTLDFLYLDARLAIPLMYYGIALENVTKLMVHMNYSHLERAPESILSSLKNFDFTSLFPNLNKVTMWCRLDHYEMLPDYLTAVTEQAEVLSQPRTDRAANVKELFVGYERDSAYVPVSFFGQMFPNIDVLKWELSAHGQRFSYGSVWEHWSDLKELEVIGWVVEQTGNLDSVFCGIFPEEVAELRLKDEEYLKKVVIVPVMPAITCLKSLENLIISRNSTGRRNDDGPYVDDGTFMFSKVTEWIVFKRRPTLAVSLNFSHHRLPPAVNHLRSFAAVTVNE